MSDPSHKTMAVIEQQSPETQDNLHPMVRAAMAQGLDPASLRELMALQREWQAGEAKRAFTRALVALKRDLPTVIDRDKLVDFKTSKGRTRYSHTSLGAIMAAVTEPLTQHGFSLAWAPSTTDRTVTVRCVLTHSEGHSEDTTISAPTDTTGSKSPAQGVASTITLLSRYSALALLGIATADMQEPTGEAEEDTSAINAARNLRAAGALGKYDKTREQAEKHLSKPVRDWSTADLEKLKVWVTPPTGRESPCAAPDCDQPAVGDSFKCEAHQ